MPRIKPLPVLLPLLLLAHPLIPTASADTLVGYWMMEDTHGSDMYDSATAGSSVDHGEWVGTAAYTDANYSPAAPFGKAAVLTGNNYISIPDSIDTDKAGEDLTVSAWFRVTSWDTSWQCLLAKGEDERYRIARYGRGGSELSFGGGGSGDLHGGSVNDGQWHHVSAVVEDGVEKRFYIDGVRVDSNSSASITNTSDPFLIGANPEADNREWKGAVDDVGIFDEAFDDAKAAALCDLAADPYGYDLGTFNEVLKLHAAGPGAAAINIGQITWSYAAINPGGGADFFLLSSDPSAPDFGSGVIANAAAILSFTATPAYIAGGQSSQLAWDTVGFTSLTLDDGSGPVSVTGQTGQSVTPTSTTTYTLTGSGSAGNLSADVTVFVDVPPSVTLSASDDTIAIGGSSTLQWTSTGANSLSIDQGIGAVSPDNGDQALSGITSTTTYTITATNASGSVTDSVTITVGDPPVIDSFTISNPNPVPYERIELSWTITAATSATISPAVGSVDPVSGTAADTPASTTTYTLTATNDFDQTSATVTANVPLEIGIDASLWTVLQRTSSSEITNLATADALLAGTNVLESATEYNVPVINYGPGNDGEFPNDGELPIPDSNDLDEFAVRATATLIVNYAGDYTFGINNDDGGRLRIDGADVIIDDDWHAPLTSVGTIYLTAGSHSIEYVYFEHGGGQAGETFFVGPEGTYEFLGFTVPLVPIATSGVIINEFMASNDATLDDYEGDSSDWIELYNGSGAAIDLAGYYLTDDDTWPGKYAIPSHVLGHGEFLVIFASGKDSTFGTDEFHTNFKLSAGGEYLGLYKDDGGLQVVTEFSPAFPPQETDASYGSWGTMQTLGYMTIPTPDGPNYGGVQGFLGDTHFDVDRGLFYFPFDLTITTDDPAATIRYTVDGSEPTLNHGNIYTGPIPISQSTVIRAAGFLDNYAPTNTDTHTYIFPDDVPLQDQALAVSLGFPDGPVNGQTYEYGMDGGGVTDSQIITALKDIPMISLVMDQQDFSSSATGIFSNAGNRGPGWERIGSVELINEDGLGAGQFQTNCGVRIRGGYSRSDSNPKHAFRLFFRNSIEGDLDYPVFQDEGPRRFEKLDLRTSQNYSWSFDNSDQNTFLREVHGRDAQGEMGQLYTRSRYYQLYINGIYWGLYMSQERAEEFYGETYLGGNEEDFDVIKSAGSDANYTTEAINGDLNGAWHDLWQGVKDLYDNDPNDDDVYFALQGLDSTGLLPHPDPVSNPTLLDVDNLADYLLAIFHTGNFDAPLSTFVQASNNWYGMRDRSGISGGFRFFVHDGEHSLGAGTGDRWDDTDDRVGPWGSIYTGRPPSDFSRSNPQYLHEYLAWNEEYRVAFGDRVHRQFYNDGPLDDTVSADRVTRRSDEIDDAVRAELARWGGGSFNYTTWTTARQSVFDFLNAGYSGATTGIGRAAYIINLLRNYSDSGSKPLYPLIDAPVYALNGGVVPAGYQLGMTNPNGTGTVYYTTDGSDPRLAGGGINYVSANIASATVTLTQSGPVKARVLIGSTWSALNDFEFVVGIAGSADNLVVSEIHYNPATATGDTFPNKDDYEFIELLNLSDTDTIELTGTIFGAGISFDFTASNVIQLAPGARVVVVSNEAAFTERYPAVPAALVAGQYTGNLDNSGEAITLLDSTGSVIKSFVYDDDVPWPTAPDGDGYSLVLNCDQSNPDHNSATSWRSHALLHGNPGGPDGTSWDNWATANGLSGAPNDDADHDGIVDIFEYAGGSDPRDPSSRNSMTMSFQSYLVAGSTQDYATVTFLRDLDAGDIILYPEISHDLVNWSSGPDDIVMVEAANQGDGTELITWRAATPNSDPANDRFFLRLKIETN